MGLNFKKRTVVGVSVTPEIGIEAALIDYEKRLLVNYVSKPFQFNSKLQGDFDLDIFKETLYDALVEIGAPQGTDVVLNLPSVVFGVKDWPASIDKSQLGGNIEDEIFDHPMFKDSADEAVYSYCVLPNSTIQFNKVVHTAVPKSLLLEIAVQIKDLKYKLMGVDTSVNSTLNALIYSGRVDVSPNVSWVMLLVENNVCRIISMLGRTYVDYREEYINIGKVLGDEENYSIVVNAVEPIIKNVPSSLLYVVSKTDIISAETLASKLSYKSQIVHQEVNMFNKTPLIDIAFDMDPEKCRLMSTDVLGAAIKRAFAPESNAPLNLFNNQLGDIYYTQTPPVFMGHSLSVENMLKYGILVAIIILAITLPIAYFVNNQKAIKESKIKDYELQIAQINKFLKEHEDISSKTFSEYDEIRIGLTNNKNAYSYYTIVGTEIPKKLWLTALKLGDQVTIEGQADNLESVYGFFRNIKDYNPSSPVKLQKLGLAGKHAGFGEIPGEDFDTESVLTTLNADFYEFRISDQSAEVAAGQKPSSKDALPNLEPLE